MVETIVLIKIKIIWEAYVWFNLVVWYMIQIYFVRLLSLGGWLIGVVSVKGSMIIVKSEVNKIRWGDSLLDLVLEYLLHLFY